MLKIADSDGALGDLRVIIAGQALTLLVRSIAGLPKKIDHPWSALLLAPNVMWIDLWMKMTPTHNPTMRVIDRSCPASYPDPGKFLGYLAIFPNSTYLGNVGHDYVVGAHPDVVPPTPGSDIDHSAWCLDKLHIR